MTNELRIFGYEGNTVRTIERDGVTWFVAKDVCDILEIQNVTQAINQLDDDEKMTLCNSEGHSGQRGGAQFLNVITESGVYALVFRSRKPEARKFSKWVRTEVLPEIRRTGSYGVTAELLRAKVQERANEIEAAKVLQDMVKTPAYGLSEKDKRKITRELALRLAGIDVLAEEPPKKNRRKKRYVETDPELIDFRTPSEIADAPYDVINV